MSTISATEVRKLRDMTNAAMMDCKAALEKAGGDFQKAIQLLRESGKAKAGKVEGRETAEGRIAIFIDTAKSRASILEFRCESAPVAKNDLFIQLANDVAQHVAELGVADSMEALVKQPYFADAKRTVKDRMDDLIGLIKENMKPARATRLEGGVFGFYVHFDGSVGVLLQCEQTGTGAADTQVMRDVCMHITAKNPVSATRDDIDPKVLEQEREIARNQAAATGKPANIVDKIAEGKLKTWFAENVLVEQPFVKDDTKTVGDLLKSVNLQIKKFVRYKVGEVTL
jgi:elongation factor Ts